MMACLHVSENYPLGTVHFCVRILKIRTMFGFGWVGVLRRNECSDFRRKNKYVHRKKCFSTKHFSFPVCIYYFSRVIWSNGLKKSICSEVYCTLYGGNKIGIQVYTFFFHCCSDLRVGGWFIGNPNIVRILKIRTQKWTIP